MFADNKLFSMKPSYHSPNYRIWSTKFSGKSSMAQHRQNLKSVIMWSGICATGKFDLCFTDSGVKNNNDVYQKNYSRCWASLSSKTILKQRFENLSQIHSLFIARNIVVPIFQTSLKSGPHTCVSFITWIAACGWFWK